MTWFPLLIAGIVIVAMYCTSRDVPKLWQGHVRTAPSGKAYLWECQRSRNGAPTLSRIGVPATIPYDFVLEEEKWSHMMTKTLGLCTEFQTMDEAFDKAVYIISDDVRFQQKLGMDASLHMLFLKMFINGAKTIQATKDHLVVTLKKACENLPQDQANLFCDSLHEIKQRLSAVTQGFDRQPRHPIYKALLLLFRSLHFIFFAVAGVTALLIAIMRYELVDSVPMMLTAVQLGAIITIGTLIAIRLLFGHSSYGHSMVLNLILLSSWGSMLAAGAVVYFINCAYDPSPAEIHQEPVISKRISHGKRSTSYYIRAANWHNPSETISMQVSSGLYDQIQVGRPVRIFAHAGKLQMEWIEHVDLVPIR